MQSKILENKLLVQKGDEYLVDLTSKSVEYQRIGRAVDAFLVGEDMTMRADLISKSAYGNDEDFDIILKYNGISNPFSINENDLIFIPDLSFMYESLVNPQTESIGDQVRDSYLDKTKTPEIDTKKLEYDKLIKKLQQTGPTEISLSSFGLPPNMSEPGDREGRILPNGNVIFGDYVTKNIE